MPIGMEFPVRFLAEEDYFRFDTRLRGRRGPRPEAVLEVVGTVRLAGGFSRTPPTFASARRARVAPRRLHRHELLRQPGGRRRRLRGVRKTPPRTSSGTERSRPRPPSSPWSTPSTPTIDAGRGGQHRDPARSSADDLRPVDGGGRWGRDHPSPRPAPHRHRPRPRGRAGAGADPGTADSRPSPVGPAPRRPRDDPRHDRCPRGRRGSNRSEPSTSTSLTPAPLSNVAVLAVGIVAVFVGVLAATALTGALRRSTSSRRRGAGELRREPRHPRRGLAPDGPRPPVRAGGGPGCPRRAGALRDHRRDGRGRRRRRRAGVRLQPRSTGRLPLPVCHPVRRRHRRCDRRGARGRGPRQPPRRRRVLHDERTAVDRGHRGRRARGRGPPRLARHRCPSGPVAAHPGRDHAGAPGRAGPRCGGR